MKTSEILRNATVGLILVTCSRPAITEPSVTTPPLKSPGVERPVISENNKIKDLAKNIGNSLLLQRLNDISGYYPQEYKNDKKGWEIIYDHFRFFSDPSCKERKVVATEDVKDTEILGKKAKVVAVSLDSQCLMRFRFPGTGLSFAEGGLGASFVQGLGKRIAIGFEKYPDGQWYLTNVVPDFVPQK